MTPLVSIVTPTYNRRRFIPSLIECVKSQTYPRIEWIILDDGTDKVGDLFENVGNVRYYTEGCKRLPTEPDLLSHDVKLTIGAKRNKLNGLAMGDIIVCMDDDDYYPPECVSHCVEKLTRFNICGSSELYVFFSHNKTIYKMGPYGPNHATNGTMAYKRAYLENHKYDDNALYAEESSFLNNYTEPMAQLDPFKTQLLISHSENTFDKKKIRESPVFKLTNLRLQNFIKNEKLIEFYENL
jgi:glycosyltransferase involved in cell wall biosynthesis